VPLILPKYLRPGRDEEVSEATHSVPSAVPVAETFRRTQGINLFRCPVCHNEFRYDDEFEPMCDGPGPQRTHPMTIMGLVGVVPRLKLILPR
jgi:hypothetical protein